MTKKVFVAFICIALALCMGTFYGCTSETETQYADEAFIQSMAKGLEARWKLATKDEGKLTNDTIESTITCIQAELDQLTQYESARFEDTKLQEKAIKYINCLKDSKENVSYRFSDDYDEYEKWQEIYKTRTVLIKDFVENYGLTVSKEYQSTLDEFLAKGKSVEKSKNEKTAIQKLVTSLEFKQTKNEYDWKMYEATLENTTEYDIKSLQIDVSLLDKEGTILETRYVFAENVSKGQKAKLKFDTNTDFEKLELILDYYEINS